MIQAVRVELVCVGMAFISSGGVRRYGVLRLRECCAPRAALAPLRKTGLRGNGEKLLASRRHITHRQVPMSEQYLEPTLLFLLVGFLVRPKLLDDLLFVWIGSSRYG